MKCQNLFSGKNKKNMSKCYLKILPSMLIKHCDFFQEPDFVFEACV